MTTKREVTDKFFQGFFLPWTALLVLSHLVTMYIAPEYMWGVHFYHFFPSHLGWILALFILVLLIPGVGEFIYERVEALAKKIKRPFDSLSQNKIFLTLSLIFLPLFWIFRTRYHLLGDGYFRIKDMPEGRLFLFEWLDGFLHLVAYRVMSKLVPSWTPELTYSIISILCGGLFVFLALKLSSLVGRTGFGKVLIFSFLISLGSIQLFFGYVESYTILQVALLAYILFALLYLSGKASILFALLFLVISMGLHVTSMIFAPSFLYLLWAGKGDVKEGRGSSISQEDITTQSASGKNQQLPSGEVYSNIRRILNIPTLIILICSLALMVFWVYKVATFFEDTDRGIFILPLKETETFHFSMFSFAHISEFLNQLLLLSPVGISLAVFFLFFKVKFRDFEDKFVNFLIIASFFSLIYLFVFNFYLGSADWDLRSSPAPFFGLLGPILFLRWGERSGAIKPEREISGSRTYPADSLRGRRFKAWGLIFIWLGLFHTVPWVLINSHPKRSVDRYVLTQAKDPHPMDEIRYNPSKIENILRWAGLPEEVPRMYQLVIEKNPQDMLSYYNLATYYRKNNQYDQAILVLDTLLKINPLYPKANWMMGNIYYNRGDPVKALFYLEQASPFLTGDPDFLYQLGSTYYSSDHPDQAVYCATHIIKLKPEYLEAYQLLGLAFVKLGDFQAAREAWEHILTVNPDDSVTIRNLERLKQE